MKDSSWTGNNAVVIERISHTGLTRISQKWIWNQCENSPLWKYIESTMVLFRKKMKDEYLTKSRSR